MTILSYGQKKAKNNSMLASKSCKIRMNGMEREIKREFAEALRAL